MIDRENYLKKDLIKSFVLSAIAFFAIFLINNLISRG
jgi:hypothetical protein